ncbi:hypothetical protein ACOTTU_24375 [Roseobacter sp. EG26]|uniref:hypothetical protein n=1 Tax=Roseobacter sp. EG26 TaxID=3412477 RepID=UPI003CE4F8A1
MHDDDPFILPDLQTVMRCGVFSNGRGEVLIVHDESIGSLLWVEINFDEKTVVLIFEDGQSQNLGLELDPRTISNLRACSEVVVAHLSDKGFGRSQKIPAVLI